MRRSHVRLDPRLAAIAGVATAAMLAGVPSTSADHDRGRVEAFAISQQQAVQVLLSDGSAAEGRFRSDLHVFRDGTAQGSAHLEYARRTAADEITTERLSIAYGSARVSEDGSSITATETTTATGPDCGDHGTGCARLEIRDIPESVERTGDDLIYDIVGPNGSEMRLRARGHALVRHEHTRPG